MSGLANDCFAGRKVRGAWRAAGVACLLGVGLAFGVPLAEASETPGHGKAAEAPAEPEQQLFEAALRRADAGDYKAARAMLNAAAASPDFNQLNSDQRRTTYFLLGELALEAADKDAAFEWAKKATGLPEAGSNDWGLRLRAAEAVGDVMCGWPPSRKREYWL